MIKRIVLILVLTLIPLSVQGNLFPEEVAIISVDTPQSQQVAQYYAQARKIPLDNILTLSLDDNAELSRNVWVHEIRPQIRNWLQSKRRKIRCVVTVWGCPLRIGQAPSESYAQTDRLIELNQTWQAKLIQASEVIQRFDSIAVTQKPGLKKLPVTSKVKEVIAEINESIKNAQFRIRRQSPELQKRLAIPFQNEFIAVAGVKGLYQNLQSNADKLPEDKKTSVTLMGSEISAIENTLAEFQFLPCSALRDTFIINNLEKIGGLMASMQWIENQIEQSHTNETMAAFDSELALILLPDHDLNRWLPNPLYYGAASAIKNLPTLIVARLEAPTVEIVKRMIDQSIETEGKRLSGKLYIDAKYYIPSGNYAPGSYERYDQSLYLLDKRIKTNTKMASVFDSNLSLFSEGTCPDTALYVGWYSLGKYIPSCKWNPGSIGMHLASSEACNLRDSTSTLWCPQMLINGAAAVVGPTFEPYLGAFPQPDYFFSLILTGDYTLGEAFAYTQPYVSWSIILIGDPLYRPYKINPPLSRTNLPPEFKTGLGNK